MLSFSDANTLTRRCVWVNGPVIVGAGPSGLAVAAGLRQQGVPFVIVERADCIASLWQKHTYDRLKLHLPKQFCQLPGFPFPDHYPRYPNKKQFVAYIESYASHFDINPHFNECVVTAKYDDNCRLWRVRTASPGGAEVEYICQSLVVASGENAECVVPEIPGLAEFGGEVIHAGDYKSGENAECVVPEIPGLAEFGGEVIHAGDYKSGEKFKGRKVLVVGCGNSGMEVSLDLCNHEAKPAMVVRSAVHVLPREVMGKSTFEIAMLLMKWLPLWLVDKIMLFLAWAVFGNMERYGLKRPLVGPLELKNKYGKTPVLDVGALEKIRSREIEVLPEITSFSSGAVNLVNGEKKEIDSVILATGYRSNVPYWLQESEFFGKNGFPKKAFPNGWKGKGGIYAVGFTRRGLAGASADAVRVSQDIGRIWKDDLKLKKQKFPTLRRCISTF